MDYMDGLLKGCAIKAQSGMLTIGKGMLKFHGFIYLMQEDEKVPYSPADGWQSLKAEFTEDEGASWTALPEETVVSMNLWGFTPSILRELEKRFPAFLDQGLKSNPQKCEYFLPFVVDELLKEGLGDVKVLRSPDNWYGVTYKEDKEKVAAAIARLKEEGLYPKRLWE